MKKDLLPFEMSAEEHEKLLKDVSSTKYYQNQFEKIKDDPNRIYYDKNLRQKLYERGFEIPTGEMSRDFYLKNRIKSNEFQNLVNVLEIFQTSKAKNKFSYSWGLTGVGTSVYEDAYYSDLEKYLLEQGLTKEDYIKERTIDNWDETKGMSYEEYVSYCKNRSPAWDEQWEPVSKEKFEEWKKGEQEDYSIKKKVGSILDNKGEDLDFVFLREDNSENLNYTREKAIKFSDIFYQSLKEKNFDIKKEESFLMGANYNFLGGNKLYRNKTISGKNGVLVSYKINFENARSLHFYIRNEQADLRLKREKIENLPFCLLVRKSDYQDLISAFENGNKTGTYENPRILKFLNKK